MIKSEETWLRNLEAMMMPIMDGTATIQALQKLDPQVRIICMSGLSSKPDLAAATSLNIQGSLKKPFTPENLLSTVHRVISDEIVSSI